MIPDTLFSSTILPTVGRPELTRAVESILSQNITAVDFEVIIVNDSGNPLPDASWQQDERVKVIHTHRRERSVARNTGACLARGRYLHFLDDDDWLAPSSLQHFWELSRSSTADWLYGWSQLVDRQSKPIIQLKHGLQGNCFTQVMAGEWIPLQASLIESELFFTIGGFNPLLTGPEDIDLLRRAALVSELAETPQIVANIIRGEQGSTTDYQAHPQASRWAREKIIDRPGVYQRMRLSDRSHALNGRITRIYLTSMLWNLYQRRPLTAISRGVTGLSSMIQAGPGLLSLDYWKAISTAYASPTFKRGFENVAR
jgi:glycosyltransferase involved in cell wall biosynthesis